MLENSKTSGFTLIELLIVLAIVGLASGVAAPKLLKLYSRSSEHSELQKFAQVLKQSQFQAWKTGRAIRLEANKIELWPVVPVDWEIIERPSLYFLTTGVTNGGVIKFKAPSSRLWSLNIAPLNGKISLQAETISKPKSQSDEFKTK